MRNREKGTNKDSRGWFDHLIDAAKECRDYFPEIPSEGILREWERTVYHELPEGGDEENEGAVLLH
jgi:hypothetical protein